MTADVTVNPNWNEIRDYKYVDKEELQAMFEDPGHSHDKFPLCDRSLTCANSEILHTVVQTHRA
jgi:isopentenyldiphosphate isomerase